MQDIASICLVQEVREFSWETDPLGTLFCLYVSKYNIITKYNTIVSALNLGEALNAF